MKHIKNIVLPILLLGLAYLVFFQPEFLTLSINKQNTIPAGTIISWLFIVVFVLLFLFNISIKTSNLFDRVLRFILFGNVFLAFFWGLISYSLAGNWTFNFDNESQFFVWIAITALILIVPVLIALIKIFRKLIRKN